MQRDYIASSWEQLLNSGVFPNLLRLLQEFILFRQSTNNTGIYTGLILLLNMVGINVSLLKPGTFYGFIHLNVYFREYTPIYKLYGNVFL